MGGARKALESARSLDALPRGAERPSGFACLLAFAASTHRCPTDLVPGRGVASRFGEVPPWSEPERAFQLLGQNELGLMVELGREGGFDGPGVHGMGVWLRVEMCGVCGCLAGSVGRRRIDSERTAVFGDKCAETSETSSLLHTNRSSLFTPSAALRLVPWSSSGRGRDGWRRLSEDENLVGCGR